LLIVYFHCNGILEIEGEKHNLSKEILQIFSRDRLMANVPEEERDQMDKKDQKTKVYKDILETSGEILNQNEHGFGLKYNPTLLNSVKNLNENSVYNSEGFVPQFSTKIDKETHTSKEVSLEDLIKLKGNNSQHRLQNAENGTEMNMF